MRLFLVHILILSPLIILGIASFAIETLETNYDQLGLRYAFTIFYWVALIGYSLFSTFIVLSVGIFYKIMKRSFTKKAVILSHVILIGLLCIFVSLGFHGLIEDAWKNKTKKFEHIPKRVQIDQTEKKPFPIPTVPVTKKSKYKTTEKPVVELDKQKND